MVFQPEVVIKIPANETGFSVATQLALPQRITLTAVYSEGQVMAAEALEVAYTAPYYARLKDAVITPRKMVAVGVEIPSNPAPD